MKTMAHFTSATPAEKSQMVIEAFNYLTSENEKMATNAKVLAAWLKSMPALVEVNYAEPIDLKALNNAWAALAKAYDELAVHHIDISVYTAKIFIAQREQLINQ